MISSLDKLARNLQNLSRAQWHKYKGNMEMVDISNMYIALQECKRCKTKEMQDQRSRGRSAKKNLIHTSRF